MAQWRAAVGLEIHAQILSKSKIFSRGSTKKCESSNSGIHFFDIGLPGALPVRNTVFLVVVQLVSAALDVVAAPSIIAVRQEFTSFLISFRNKGWRFLYFDGCDLQYAGALV